MGRPRRAGAGAAGVRLAEHARWAGVRRPVRSSRGVAEVLPDRRNIGGEFKGYILDKKERPTFHYILGDVDIQEQPLPDLQKTASLIRKFHLEAKQPVAGLDSLVASGGKIEQTSPGIWSVDGNYSVKLDAAGMTPALRSDGNVRQLLLPSLFKTTWPISRLKSRGKSKQEHCFTGEGGRDESLPPWPCLDGAATGAGSRSDGIRLLQNHQLPHPRRHRTPMRRNGSPGRMENSLSARATATFTSSKCLRRAEGRYAHAAGPAGLHECSAWPIATAGFM